MGYLRGIVHGAVVGTVIGICIAPQEGEKTRAQVQRVARSAQDGFQRAQLGVRRLGPTVQVAAARVGEVVGQVRERVGGDREADADEQLVGANGHGPH